MGHGNFEFANDVMAGLTIFYGGVLVGELN